MSTGFIATVNKIYTFEVVVIESVYVLLPTDPKHRKQNFGQYNPNVDIDGSTTTMRVFEEVSLQYLYFFCVYRLSTVVRQNFMPSNKQPMAFFT